MNAPIDISGVTLRTPRLLLRPWQESDLDDFYEYASVDGVGQMAGWLPHKDKAESARILKMFIDEKKTLALEFEGKVIGSIGIERYDEEKLPEMASQRCREIGYVLSKDYWGWLTSLKPSGWMPFCAVTSAGTASPPGCSRSAASTF